jgi:membrane associated rhomboid family serine protease
VEASTATTCYRHSDRETGVSCSSCGRPICPDCMTPTPVGMRCPECSRQKTKVRTAATMSGDPQLTYVLIAINVIAFVAMAAGGGGLLSRGGGEVYTNGALFGPAVADGDWWRIVTAGFLHAGLLHLAFNMYFLWFLGALMENSIGKVRFAIIYFVSLLGGSFGALLLSPNAVTVGASGAVFGMMGAAIIGMRARRGPDAVGPRDDVAAQPRHHARDPRDLDRRPHRRPRGGRHRRLPDVRGRRPAARRAGTRAGRLPRPRRRAGRRLRRRRVEREHGLTRAQSSSS